MASPLLAKKEKPWRKKLAKVLAGAVLAAGIFGAKPARADPPTPPPPPPRVEQTYSVLGGFRFSRTPGVSFDPFSQRLSYSGFTYGLGDEDFKLRFRGQDTGVIDFFEHHDYSDLSKLGDLVDFSHHLLDNLGIDRPGSYSYRPRASLEAFGEGYSRFRVPFRERTISNEIGFTAYMFAKGRSYLDVYLNYDNPVLPLMLDSNMRAGYDATLRTHLDLGMETQTGGPVGFGITARRFNDFNSYGWMNSDLHFSLASGFDAGMQEYFWKRKVEGWSFLPYVTLNMRDNGIRYLVNLGPDIRVEHVEEKTSSRDARTGRDNPPEVKYNENYRQVRMVPTLGYLMAFENAGPVIPIFSFGNRDGTFARGTLGVMGGRAMVSATADSARSASTESFIVLDGSVRRSDYVDYLVSSDAARMGFFPAFRSRMMGARHDFITSSEKLLLRNAISYDREFSELSSESGFILSRSRYFIDSGIRMFNSDGFGGGLYVGAGNRNIYFASSYSQTLGGSGPTVQNVLFTLGGVIR